MYRSVQDKVQRAVEAMGREEAKFLSFLLRKAADLIEEGEDERARAWMLCAVKKILRVLRDHEIVEIP